MKVFFSHNADINLEQIGDFIAIDNPHRALTFIEELHTAARNLADMPYAFPLIPNYEHHGIRRRPYGDYLIFYHIAGDVLTIIHILHGAVDYEALLFPAG